MSPISYATRSRYSLPDQNTDKIHAPRPRGRFESHRTRGSAVQKSSLTPSELHVFELLPGHTGNKKENLGSGPRPPGLHIFGKIEKALRPPSAPGMPPALALLLGLTGGMFFRPRVLPNDLLGSILQKRPRGGAGGGEIK